MSDETKFTYFANALSGIHKYGFFTFGGSDSDESSKEPPIVLLINGLDVRVIHAATGEVLRQVTLNPNQHYYGTGKPRGGPQRPYGPRKPNRRNK